MRVELQLAPEVTRTLRLSQNNRFLVGRSDGQDEDGEETGTDLMLDLGPYNGADSGVSRIHAAFSYREGIVYLEDLNSTNGTRINGLRLNPNQLYRLREGDDLEFGSARVILNRFIVPTV
ncbi:MAG: FHA domain-containing protein [Anaerolineae bacterium]|nr:FHA domain-containing protein [Anaerolineae bacterium]